MPDADHLTLKWTNSAFADVKRLRDFIEPHNPEAARRAAASLKQAAHRLLAFPGISTRLEGRQDRELFVPFGRRGYVIRYRLAGDEVVILKVWLGLEDR